MKDEKLYRYRSVTNHSISEFINDEIVISSLDTFNDPTDGVIGFSNIDFRKELTHLSVIERLMAGKIGTGYFDSPNVKRFTTLIYDDQFSSFIKNFKKHVLVGCFTIVNNNPVMWSHYSDYRKGFVLGYDRKILTNSIMITKKNEVNSFYEVDYKNEMLDVTKEIVDSINLYTSLDGGLAFTDFKAAQDNFNNLILTNKSRFLKALSTKSKEWEYEKETRLICYDKESNGNCHKSVGKCIPNEIIIGDKVSTKDKYLLYSIAYTKGIDVYQLIILFKKGQFGLMPIPIPKESVKYYLEHGELDIKLDDFLSNS